MLLSPLKRIWKYYLPIVHWLQSSNHSFYLQWKSWYSFQSCGETKNWVEWRERENRRGTARDEQIILQKLLRWTVFSQDAHSSLSHSTCPCALWPSHCTIKKWSHCFPLCISVGLSDSLVTNQQKQHWWIPRLVQKTRCDFCLFECLLSMLPPGHSLLEASCHATRCSSHIELYTEGGTLVDRLHWAQSSSHHRPETRYTSEEAFKGTPAPVRHIFPDETPDVTAQRQSSLPCPAWPPNLQNPWA